LKEMYLAARAFGGQLACARTLVAWSAAADLVYPGTEASASALPPFHRSRGAAEQAKPSAHVVHLGIRLRGLRSPRPPDPFKMRTGGIARGVMYIHACQHRGRQPKRAGVQPELQNPPAAVPVSNLLPGARCPPPLMLVSRQNTLFENNVALAGGAVMLSSTQSVVIDNCTFRGWVPCAETLHVRTW
jgi:hypothetical protein